jgi:hypothetical protein
MRTAMGVEDFKSTLTDYHQHWASNTAGKLDFGHLFTILKSFVKKAGITKNTQQTAVQTAYSNG